jgi:hypothetical protein
MVKHAELTSEQRKLSPEELKKDVQARLAEKMLQELDPNVHIEWVKSDGLKVSGRRVIQMEG